MEGVGLTEQLAEEIAARQSAQHESAAERLERMKRALDERDRQAELLQRRLARLEEALGLKPLT